MMKVFNNKSIEFIASPSAFACVSPANPVFKIVPIFDKIIAMKLSEYKQSIKELVDSTNNEMLLKHWQKQLAWDIEHQNEIELSSEEWYLVQEGIADYEDGEVISLEDFINKRK